MANERKRAVDFAGRLREVYGEELWSVLLYGSAARGDYREGVSNLNLLVILRTVDPAALRRGSALAREWLEAGNPPPLMLSEAEWRRSADVFPIEYTDIREANVLLHGADPLAGIEVHWEHLRLRCEHELRGKLIQLREGYMLAAEAPEGLGELLTRALPTFLALFRAMLRLVGEAVPREPEDVFAAVAHLSGFDPEPLRQAWRARAGSGYAPAADAPGVVGYLAAVERAASWLDGLEPGDRARAV